MILINPVSYYFHCMDSLYQKKNIVKLQKYGLIVLRSNYFLLIN